MNCPEYKLIKRIKKRPDTDDVIILRKYRCDAALRQAFEDELVAYKEIGFRTVDSNCVFGLFPEYSKKLTVTEKGESAFIEYLEKRNTIVQKWFAEHTIEFTALIIAIIALIRTF